jgi:DNA-binding NtrC family response regulator
MRGEANAAHAARDRPILDRGWTREEGARSMNRISGTHLRAMALVVATERQERERVVDVLTNEGYYTLAVDAVLHARELIEAVSPALVVCAYELADGTADDLLSAFSEQDAPPAVVLTKSSRGEGVAAAYDAEVVRTPFDDARLVDAVRRAQAPRRTARVAS